MTIYEMIDMLADAVHSNEVANGELIPDATLTITVGQAQAIHKLLLAEVEVRKRRASTGGRGGKGSIAVIEKMAKARAARAARLEVKHD